MHTIQPQITGTSFSKREGIEGSLGSNDDYRQKLEERLASAIGDGDRVLVGMIQEQLAVLDGTFEDPDSSRQTR